MEIRDSRYARAIDGAYIAYQTVGEGPVDVVWQLDWFGNIDVIWEDPSHVEIMSSLSRFARIILHDRRATGLSSRNVAPPNLETRVSDLLCVLDAVDSQRPVLSGARESGAPNALLAATEPERVQSLMWYVPEAKSVWAPDYPWGARPEYVESDERAIDLWGTTEYGEAWVETEATAGHVTQEGTPGLGGLLSRNTTTPDVAKEIGRIWNETDIRELLRTVRVPTLLMVHAESSDVAEAEYVASLMPEAELVIIPGTAATTGFETSAEVMRKFMGVERPVGLDTVLATVLFTDIVGSTARQAMLGDRGWKQLVERHHAFVRDSLVRWRGVEVDTAGDGFYATFDGPARAIRAAMQIRDMVRELGIEVRAGVHTGECEVIDDKVGGIAVVIGRRISEMAGPSEILISQTVKDLVAGSGLTFEDSGEHELKGVPDRWNVYRVAV
jgi:class 3 adenylate cyclase